MKIKVEGEKIIKAVKKLEGIEIVLENVDDAREAINMILRKAPLPEWEEAVQPKDVKVTAFQEYETSAVNYKVLYLLEFLFEENVSLDTKVSFIKGLQQYFAKA